MPKPDPKSTVSYKQLKTFSAAFSEAARKVGRHQDAADVLDVLLRDALSSGKNLTDNREIVRYIGTGVSKGVADLDGANKKLSKAWRAIGNLPDAIKQFREENRKRCASSRARKAVKVGAPH